MQAQRRIERWSPLLLWLAMALWSIVFSVAAIAKLRRMGMGFDLGIHEQVFWNTVHGRIAASSPLRGTSSYFGVDIIVTELLLTPIYALWQRPETLLLAQVLIVPFGALALCHIARHRELSPIASLVAGLLYLLALPIQYTTLYEFQIRIAGAVCFLWAFWCVETRRFGWFLLFSFLALGTRAEAGFALAGIGVYSALHRHALRWVLVPIVLGLGWLVLSLRVLIPLARDDGGFLYSFLYGWLGDGPRDMLRTLVTRPLFVAQQIFTPGKLRYLIELGAPLLFLFVLRPDIALIALPSLMLNLLSQERIHWSIRYHYQTFILPWLLIAAVYAIADLCERDWSRHWWRPALGAVLLSSLLSNVLLGTPLRSLAGHEPRNPRVDEARALAARIPPGESVTASNKFGPLVARRQGLYYFPGNIVYPKEYIPRGKWLLVDRRDLAKDCRPRLDMLLRSGSWQVQYDKNDFLLLRKVSDDADGLMATAPPCGSEPGADASISHSGGGP